MKNLLKMFVTVSFLALLAVSMTGCGGGHNQTWFFPKAPDAPTGVLAAFDSYTSVTIRWDSVPKATSYNIYYSADPDFTLTSGTKTKISGVTSSPYHFTDATLIDNTTYYFIVTAVKAGKESVASLKVSAIHIHATFAQTDLEGPWYITVFRTGVGNPPTDLGWLRMRVTLDAAGNATINSYEQSDGVTTIPIGALGFTIDADGIVTQTGDFGGLTSHNVMSSNKTLIIGSNTISASVQEIRIIQKADVLVTFSDSDLMSKSFVFHQLASGAEDGWVRGAGSIDAARQVTITSIIDSAGGGTIPAVDTLSIDANGVVTSLNEPNFQGVMSLDKTLIVGTTKDVTGTSFQLRVIQVSGGTFTMADLAGAYNFSSLFGGASALWQYGSLTINLFGETNFLTYLDSTGSSVLPPNYTLSMDAAGTITSAADVTLHGTMSSTKDLMVSTFTVNPGASELYGLSLAVK